jgi:hypothetical protein
VIAEHLLTSFTQTSVVPAHQLRKSASATDEDGASISTGMGFKYIKTKDSMKDLIVHMIGIMGFLNKSFKAHFIAKMLKKELSDLKSYFQELGFSYDPVKENGQEDLIVRRPHGADSLLFLTAKEQR